MLIILDGRPRTPNVNLKNILVTNILQFPSDCGPIPGKTGYLFGEPDPDTKYGSVVSVSCDNCYQGPPTKTELKCQANGDWESAAGCSQIGTILQQSLSCLKMRFQMFVLICQG